MTGEWLVNGVVVANYTVHKRFGHRYVLLVLRPNEEVPLAASA